MRFCEAKRITPACLPITDSIPTLSIGDLPEFGIMILGFYGWCSALPFRTTHPTSALQLILC
jgi:hypothetical protein